MPFCDKVSQKCFSEPGSSAARNLERSDKNQKKLHLYILALEPRAKKLK